MGRLGIMTGYVSGCGGERMAVPVYLCHLSSESTTSIALVSYVAQVWHMLPSFTA